EEIMAEIWAEVLGLEQIGVEDNFFELGGHSLKATQAMSRINDTFQIDFSVRNLFSYPTVACLTEFMLKDESNRAIIESTAELLIQMTELSDDEVETLFLSKSEK